eukprot:COSAG02_NODE_977_length_15502_cov_235.762838_11_plen_1407_part_00
MSRMVVGEAAIGDLVQATGEGDEGSSVQVLVHRLESLSDAVEKSLPMHGGIVSPDAQIVPLKSFIHNLAPLVWDRGWQSYDMLIDSELRRRAVNLITHAKDWVLALCGINQLRELGDDLSSLSKHLANSKKRAIGLVPTFALLEEMSAATTETTQRLRELERAADQQARELQDDPAPQTGWDSEGATEAVQELIAAHSPAATEATDKEALRKWLQDLLQDEMPGAELKPYGSSASGLGLRAADLDLCLVMAHEDVQHDTDTNQETSEPESGHAREAQLVQRMADIVSSRAAQLDSLHEHIAVEVRASARVPILTLTVTGLPFFSAEQAAARRRQPFAGEDATASFDCDICVGHMLPQKNTALLRTYCDIDPRAKQLILAVKIWAKAAGVADSVNGTLASYSWSLLCVFFLQRCEPPVLPLLQSDELIGERWISTEHGCNTSFCGDAEEARAALSVHNSSNVGELLLGFFSFFGSLNFEKVVVSTRRGQLRPRKEEQRKTKWRMCIEDPFELEHDLGNVISCSTAQVEISKALREAAAALRRDEPRSALQPAKPCAVVRSCHNCCQVGHATRDCPHAHWPLQMLCFSCGQPGHKYTHCPEVEKGLKRTTSQIAKLNGMKPFPHDWNPQDEMQALPIPDVFDDEDEYFDTMYHNIKAEVSLMVRYAEPTDVVAEVCPMHGKHYVLRFPPSPDAENSWFNHLLRNDKGDFFVVRDEKPEEVVEYGGQPSMRLVMLAEMDFYPTGTLLGFRDYGFLGDLIGSYNAVSHLQEMHSEGEYVSELLPTILSAGRDVAPGEFAPNDGVVRGNTLQHEALATKLCNNMTVIQGPPGTGKTFLISKMLQCKIMAGTSALVTSVSNQAIDNLCEVLVRSCPDVRFCVLGNLRNFRSSGRDHLFRHSLEVQVAVELCGDELAELPLDQLLVFILSVGIDGMHTLGEDEDEQNSYNLRPPQHLPHHMRRPWALMQEAVETYRRGRKSDLEAQLEELQCDETAPVFPEQRSHRKDSLAQSIRECIECTGAMRTQALLHHLITDAESRVIDRCTAFVCTVGSIERAKNAKLEKKHIQTAIVDESSLLPEFAVPRLLVTRGIANLPAPWIKNLVLVGDHKQLASFSYGPSVDNGSLMQRVAEVSGCHMLEEQYRMDPAICGLVSELFYSGRLYTNANTAIERRKARQNGPDGQAQPVRLYDIVGEERHPQQHGGEKSMSWENVQEANAIVQWYTQRRNKGSRDRRSRNRKQTVLIICLYAAQVKLLKQLLPADTEYHDFSRYGKFRDKALKIVTVDSAQGSEAEIVALSCVRSNYSGSIGHAKNMKRACVALSRARGELHIFANVETMGSQRNRMWREVFELVEHPTDRSLCKDPYEQFQYLGFSYEDVEDADWPQLPSNRPRQIGLVDDLLDDDDGLAAAC